MNIYIINNYVSINIMNSSFVIKNEQKKKKIKNKIIK